MNFFWPWDRVSYDGNTGRVLNTFVPVNNEPATCVVVWDEGPTSEVWMSDLILEGEEA